MPLEVEVSQESPPEEGSGQLCTDLEEIEPGEGSTCLRAMGCGQNGMPLGKPAKGRVADQVSEARGVLALQKFT